jgi:hypothetical protein
MLVDGVSWNTPISHAVGLGETIVVPFGQHDAEVSALHGAWLGITGVPAPGAGCGGPGALPDVAEFIVLPSPDSR